MDIIAHRGASFDAPENTLAAVRLAWEQGADGIEVDVMRTRDGEFVLMHDANTQRTTGHVAELAELTWSDLQQLDAGTWMHPRWTGERVPLLQDVLAGVPVGKKVFIELKFKADALRGLADVIAGAGLAENQVVLVCEFLDVMQEARRLLPEHEGYWIVNLRKQAHRADDPALPAELVEGAAGAGLTGLSLRCMPFVDEEFVRVVEEAGQRVFVWTVNELDEALRMRELGVAYLCTDRPGWMRGQLGG